MPSVCLQNASLSLILASSFTWSAAAAPARADLKIVTEVTTTRSSPDAAAEGRPGLRPRRLRPLTRLAH